MTALGSIVADEIIVPVVRIHLAGGGFVVTARASGPLPAVDTARFVLMDQDGGVVALATGGPGPRLAWPQLPGPTHAVLVTVTVSLNGQTATLV